MKRISVFFVILLLSLSSLAFATSADQLVKDLNTGLRNAQSAYFNQKFENSKVELEKCGAMLAELKQLDAQHKQLKSFEQRYDKLKSDLEKKLNKGAPKATTTQAVAGEKSAPAKKPASQYQSKSLPRKTAQEVRELDRALDNLENSEKGRLQRLAEGHNTDRIEQIIGQVEEKVSALDGLLENATAAAQAENALEHADFVAVKERVAKVRDWALQEVATTREKAEKLVAGQAAAADATEKIKKLFAEHDEKFFSPITNLSYQNTMEAFTEAFNKISEFNGVKAQVLQHIGEFEEKYGSSREDIEKATGGMEAVYPWENLKKALKDMEEIPLRIAEQLKNMIDDEISSLSSRHDFYRLDRHAEIKKIVAFCEKNVSGFASAADITAKLDADLAKFNEKIAGKSWAENQGSAADQAAALDYFNRSWGQDPKHNYKVLGTVVRGEWSVQKKDLLGQPIMYGLPVLLAVQKPEDKEHGLARVFNLTVRTAEGAGVKMAPPFTSDTVGDSFFIKADKIK